VATKTPPPTSRSPAAPPATPNPSRSPTIPPIISYATLLRVYFTIFDPDHLNRQGNDVGTNYRSTLFYSTDAEKEVAQDYIHQLDDAHVYKDPIVTSLEPLKGFYTAEEYHQHFADKNPDYPYVQFCDVPKLKVLHEKFADLLKPQKS
jgi:peptide-methionine (S)-S-oxide reductase